MQNLVSLSSIPSTETARRSSRKISNAIGDAIAYCQVFNRSHDAVIRVYDDSGNVIETHEHTADFKEPEALRALCRRYHVLAPPWIAMPN